MSDAYPPRPGATYADIEALPENLTGELEIDLLLLWGETREETPEETPSSE